MHTPALLIAAALALGACASPPAARVELGHAGRGPAAVACVERHAARVGAEVLARGGNAADATVAAALALAVTWPPAGNLGGGGVLVLHAPDGHAAALDFREAAPAAVDRRFFLDPDGAEDPSVRAHPALPVGVPGTPAGLAALHARHGSRPWAELVEPARRLAAEGFVVDAELHAWIAAYAEQLAARPSAAAVLLDAHGRAPAVGSRLVQPALAATLATLRDEGAGAFYAGPLAEALVADLADAGGVLTTDDLAAYAARWRRPIRVPVGARAADLPPRDARDDPRAAPADAPAAFELIGMPPPSSGGVALAQILGVLQRLDAPPLTTPLGRHLFVEASRRAFAERARFLGDPDQSAVPTAALLAPAHLDALAAGVDRARATPSAALGPPLTAPEPEDTTQLSVVDATGLAVSCTLTLEAAFGSRHLGPRTGVLFNNQLNDFNRVPGLTDTHGRIGTAVNEPAAGRRPLTSMSPFVLLRDGAPWLVAGSPGGRTILSTTAGLAWRALTEPTLDAAALVRAPRLHHGWFPDRVELEPGRLDVDALDELAARGHVVLVRDAAVAPLHGTQGAAHLLLRAGRGAAAGWQAAGDPRRDGWAAWLAPAPSRVSARAAAPPSPAATSP